MSPLALRPAGGRPAPRPNILFVVIGRRDRFGCYGYDRGTTPTIDGLARESLVFDHMIATAPWTLPSHASLFTGLYSREHGADRPALKMREGVPTLAEFLAQHGYTPLVVSNNPFVSRRWGIVNGEIPVLMRRDFDPDFRRGIGATWSRRIKTVLGTTDKGAGATNRLIGRLLPTLGTPFFLFINYMECHWYYFPPRSFERRFARGPSSPLHSARRRLRLRRSWEPELAEKPAEVVQLSDLYDASLAYVDKRIEELFDLLRRDGRLDDTVIVVTADHGEELGDHGLIGHGMHLYQSLLHVPFLVHIPGRRAMRIDGRPSSPISLRDCAGSWGWIPRRICVTVPSPRTLSRSPRETPDAPSLLRSGISGRATG